MVIINHHNHSTKSGVQDIALCSTGAKNKGNSSEMLKISFMRLSPLHNILATAYKEVTKRNGNHNQGPWIYGEKVVKSGRAKIIQAQKENPRGCYCTPSKDRSKIVIYADLNVRHAAYLLPV